MSTGKYSPLCPHAHESGWGAYQFNCYGEVPAEWNQELCDSGVEYDSKNMFDDYDDEGFDSYGYSAFDAQGNFVGHGQGIDRYGYKENDYLMDTIRGGTLHQDLQGWGGEVLNYFHRNR